MILRNPVAMILRSTVAMILRSTVEHITWLLQRPLETEEASHQNTYVFAKYVALWPWGFRLASRCFH